MEDQKPEEKPTELEECKQKCDEYLNGWKRAKADFVNYKKEEFERVQEVIDYAKASFLESMLPMMDNLEITASKLPEELKNDSNVAGLLMIKTQLEDFLKSHNVEPFESVGKKFDPAMHEAVQTVEEKDKESGIILEELEKGYTINGRLLRPAKVKVAK